MADSQAKSRGIRLVFLILLRGLRVHKFSREHAGMPETDGDESIGFVDNTDWA